MKIVSENGKLFGKINIIDLLVILLVILACVFVFIKLGIVGPSEKSNVVYSIEVLGVREETYSAIEKNLNGVYSTSNGKKTVLGDIISIEKKPARELTVLENGEYTYAEYTDKFDVTITLRSDCKVKEKGIFLPDGTQLLCGDPLKFSNGYCETGGEVVSITVD